MKKILLVATLLGGVSFSSMAAEKSTTGSSSPKQERLAAKPADKIVQLDGCNCYPVSACGSSQVLCWCNDDQAEKVQNQFIKQACGV